MARHNKLRDGVAELSVKYVTPTHMRNNPLIFVGCAMQMPKAQPDGTTPYLSKRSQSPQTIMAML